MIAVMVSFLVSCLTTGAAAQTYTVTDLGTLHAGSARVHGDYENFCILAIFHCVLS